MVQWGIVGNFAYAIERDYRNLQGQRHNNDLEQLTLGLNLKQQIGVNDSLYFRTVYYNANGGDLTHVYDPSNPAFYRPNLRFQEAQEPLLLAGYHHQWSPSQHTLVLASRMHDRLEVSDPTQPILLVGKDPTNAVTGTLLTSAEQHYRSELEIYSAEVQHIAQVQAWTVVGAGERSLGNSRLIIASRIWLTRAPRCRTRWCSMCSRICNDSPLTPTPSGKLLTRSLSSVA